MDSLEEYLAGTLEPAAQRKIEAHLGSCETCIEELASMQELSRLFGSLRSEDVVQPAPGFFARVMRQVGEREAVPSFWNVFALDLAFRRLVFASLVTLAILGTYLVSREARYPAGPSPAAIMAEQNSPAFDSAPAQENMLVTLTAYERF
jgi:anti-sigma factor RsiW